MTIHHRRNALRKERAGFTPALTVSAGFTLVELLVVISIISVLASVVLTSVNSVRAKARDALRKAEMTELVKALELYYDAYGRYPPFRASNSCGGIRSDWATSKCSDPNWLTADNNFLSFIPVVPRDPINTIGSGGQDTPWWFALTYTYGVTSDGQIYDILTNLENKQDPDRCELKLWRSHAVWPTDTGCYATATLGSVPDRSKQIYAPK
ncbi:MAG: putative General secretion pathway protein GspG [Parcubacteria group bacterium Gr01-1014_33]|nr:MAG: putative General secretion pathway protein GspG [Parcubacteria group bacterium Gr01-1014_33]